MGADHYNKNPTKILNVCAHNKNSSMFQKPKL
jgi:hypothetical protein